MRRGALLALCLAGAGCSTHLGQPQTPGPAPLYTEYDVTYDVAYTPPDWPQRLLADVYRPRGAGPWPSVLLLHGGAWKRGDRDQVEHTAQRLALRGFLVVNATYRFVPHYIWPAQFRDVQQALRWMRSPEGAAHGIDPARIAAMGYSAGGHLAALLGATADDPQWGAPELAVKAVVAGGTPADLTAFCGGSLTPAFIGKPCSTDLQSYRDASPIHHISAGDPPVFVYHAGLDSLVPIENAEAYRAALERAGITNEYFVIHGNGHISAHFFDGEAIEAALAFLDRYLR